MKAIFSKTGNKKDISSKMERRSQPSSGGGQNHAIVSPSAGRVNSFIPTPSSYHQGQSQGHMTNGTIKSQSLSAMPSQQPQQISHMSQQHSTHFYSNIPGNPSNPNGTSHHYTNNYQQQSIHQSQQQQIHSRTLTKSYSSSAHAHNNQSHNQQSHYGNTTLYASNSNNNANLNQINHGGGTFYGNTATNLQNGAIIMNGHHHGHGGEKMMNGHHAGSTPGQTEVMMGHNHQNGAQHYHHEQVGHHQHQVQMQGSIQKMHVLPQQNVNASRVHHTNPNKLQQLQQPNFHHVHNQQQPNHHIVPPQNATEGLPPPLVESMRTLFDILDDSKQGKIRLSDIETRWESDSNGGGGGSGSGPNGKTAPPTGAEPLIKMGVLEYLRKVTPGDGMLTFDRFCSGLRLALLTNNGEPPDDHISANIIPPEKVQIQQQQQSRPLNQNQQPPPPQHYFQEQVRNMTNISKPIHTQIGPPPPSQPVFNGPNINNGNGGGGGNGVSVNKTSSIGQSNTISRFSKIPNFSSSRLPMLGSSSGIPLSPNNRANTIPMANTNKNGPPLHHHHYHNGTLISGTKRYPTTNPSTEHPTNSNTTIALVHPQPPPNPKPNSSSFLPNASNSQYSNGGGGGTIKAAKTGFLNRFSTKNSSLDDLQVPNQNNTESVVHQLNSGSNNKDRPPSAPILDGTEESPPPSNKQGQESQLSKQRNNRERAKSQERGNVTNNANAHISRAEEKANFIKSRQRTLSMPQLQLNKLKPTTVQPTVNFDETNSDNKMDPSPVENYPKPSTLKNHSLSKLLAGGHQYGGSSIPTMSSSNPAPPNGGTLIKNASQKGVDEMTPPPPKPPRNAMSGPVTISTTLIAGLTADPPLSGSSFGSSSATISVSASSSSGGGNTTNPEIRNVLHSWQKILTDKKPVQVSLSSTSVATNSSVNTNDTLKSSSNTVKMSIGAIGGDDVKLRPTKSSLKRKETARRHTVQSGIDFSTLKRLKQLEQERDVLQQGLHYLEKASEWYSKQLEASGEKITLLGKGAPSQDYWSESHEERLNLLGCRITEINSLLTALMDGSSQLPLHMNLQIPSHLSLRTITRLKDQNKQLTVEVGDFSHRVTQLENEKAMLLRQLFQKNNNTASDETVYM